MRLFVFLLMGVLTCVGCRAYDGDVPIPLNSVIKIDGAKKVARLSPLFYGLMTEEINHSYDGGLYAELVQNRSFQDNAARPVHWYLVQDGTALGTTGLDHDYPVNPVLRTCLRLVVKDADEKQRVGISNDGYWGIPVFPHTDYRLSFYARGLAPREKPYLGEITATLESPDGYTVYAKAVIPEITADWQSYTATLTTGELKPTTDARLVLAVTHTGELWFNQVSLFPPTWNKRPNGNRVDLMQKLADLKPAFLRLPGGNYLEGNEVPTRFDWKKTLHDISLRPGHEGPWRYRSSDGLGLREYLEWCEDLNMEPVLAVYAGYSMTQPAIKPGVDLQPFIQEALEEIEYVTGDSSTVWGRERIAEGLVDPVPLHYVEVGNEDFFDKSGSYDERFAEFYDAIKAKYPQLQVIATARVKSRRPDVLDEHFYRSFTETMGDLRHYDKYDRKGPKIFVGEWATTEGNPTPNFGAALADASWLISLERNADLVIMESYAPLFVNVNPGASQWGTNLIGFNGLGSFGSPSYYVQKMFSANHGDVVLDSASSGAFQPPYSVTYDSDKHLIDIKVVNTGNVPQNLQIEVSNLKVDKNGQAVILKAEALDEVNSLAAPVKVAPEFHNESTFGSTFTYTFPPFSATVLVLAVH